MDNEQLVRNWQRTIAGVCIEALGRQLTYKEAEFIQAHHGFLALESIEDLVRSLASQPTVLAIYLNSGATHASA